MHHPERSRRILLLRCEVFKAKKLLFAAALSLLGLAAPQSARAQFIGDVGLQTVNQVLANNVQCTGALQIFTVQNVGQISHQASAFTTAPSFTMEIDGGDGFFSQFRISNPQIALSIGGGTSAYIVQGNGYYPLVKVAVTCTAAQFFNLSYAGAQTAFSSIIGPTGGTPVSINGGIAAQVQGVVTQQQSAGAVNPIIEGGLQLPVNTNFLTAGIDNFNVSSAGISAGSSGAFTIDTVPTPTTSGEFAVAFESSLSDLSSTNIVAPWTCAPSLPGACGGGSPQMSMAFLANVSPGQKFQRSFLNSTPNGQDIAAIVLFSSSTTAIRQSALAAGVAAVSYTSNTLANSTKIAALRCSGVVPCVVSGVTDTQGGTWSQVTTLTFNNGNQSAGIVVWASQTLSTAAADTITFTLSSGTSAGVMAAELTGTTTAGLTQPAISVQADPTGRQIISQDAQFPNQFVCNVTISTATTTQCQAAPTVINNVPVRAYVTDVQVNTTTTGTASAVQLKTGTGSNCGTGTANLSAITYSTVTAAAPTLASFLGMRTPLIAPLQSAVCVTQTGTPGTAVVEVHGFFAP
jgi:hypothetical protein